MHAEMYVIRLRRRPVSQQVFVSNRQSAYWTMVGQCSDIMILNHDITGRLFKLTLYYPTAMCAYLDRDTYVSTYPNLR